MDFSKISTEEVNSFLNGRDPMERIITIECDYQSELVSIVYVNENGEKRIKKDEFKPFVWCKLNAATSLFEGKKEELRNKMHSYGIGVKKLNASDLDNCNERIQDGYKFMFYARRPMSYQRFLQFFTEGGVPIYNKKKKGETQGSSNKDYITVTPVEQYMISTGKRLFKGYENYNDLNRCFFDLETQGLNPQIHRIEQIGIRTNRGYERLLSVEGDTEEEKDKAELEAIDTFIRILSEIKPDTIVGHNSENFDWDFIITRCDILGSPLKELSQKYFKHPIYKKNKETVLKLGGEVEYFKPTVIWGHVVLDSLHAARRAQAIDSNMKKSNLKYVTKYLNLQKPNRVYVPGDKITKTWAINEKVFAFNDENGDWYKVSDERPLEEGYEMVSGHYIVERYLLDDVWETDKVEEKLNESNFLVGKLLPTTFARACTMGTAGIWKLIMLAWSYENDLVVPALGKNRRFVGGLSRLLKTGYVDRIVKLDYNSLYPSIILTWNIDNLVDDTNILNMILLYVLSQREKYKELKAEAGAKADELKETLKDAKTKKEKIRINEEIDHWKAEKSGNDKKQLPLKILGNSYFGSAGAEHLFPWGDNMAAERTTCIGRQSLRLMISHFKNIGYEPIVGDSFTGDTPLFIKYDDSGLIDIKPIEELIGETETDALGREYDTSFKAYKVLCRSGWVTPEYIYRHKTDKPLYTISEGNMSVTVTEDHSLFTDKQEKIKPSEITNDTKLEYYADKVETSTRGFIYLKDVQRVKIMAKTLKNGVIDRVPIQLLNTRNMDAVKTFLDKLEGWDYSNTSKTCRAGIQFLKKKINMGLETLT